MNIKTWAQALRLPFLTATLIPVFLGTVIAWNLTGSFNFPFFVLVLLGAISIHLGINLSNDYFDHKSGNDTANKTPTAFSGGSRVIQDGLISAKTIHAAALLFFGVGSAIGLYLNNIIAGNTLLYIGLVGVVLGYFYTAAPIRLGYRGIGELVCGIGFGPLMVLGAFYVQTGALALTPLLASIPVGILIALVLFINEFPDYEPDKLVQKNTILVRFGRKTSAKIYQILLASVYAFILVAVLAGYFPYWTLISFATLPIAIKTRKNVLQNYENITALLPANGNTILLHVSLGSLIIVSFALATIF